MTIVWGVRASPARGASGAVVSDMSGPCGLVALRIGAGNTPIVDLGCDTTQWETVR
ncbi:hypothetical protein GCM10028814_01830 [Angustibacter aerolatus]